MRSEELQVLGLHAIAVVIATEFLEAGSQDATASDWMQLILAKAKSRYEEASPEQLRFYLTQTLKAANVDLPLTIERAVEVDDDSWFDAPA